MIFKILLSRSVQTPNSDKNWQTSCPLQTFVCNTSRHLEFIIEQGHRVNWVSGFPGHWVTKCDPVLCLVCWRRSRLVDFDRALQKTFSNSNSTWVLGKAPALVSSVCQVLVNSALQPIKSGILSLHLSVPVPVLIPSVFTSRPTTATRPSSPPNPSLHAPQFRLLQANVRVYKLYVLTYLLTTSSYYFTVKIALTGVFWRLFTVHANETDFISTLNSVWIGQSY